MFITFCLVVGATVVMGAQLTVEIKVDVAAPKDVAEKNLRKRQGGILDILSGGDFVEYMKEKDDWDRKYVNSPIERNKFHDRFRQYANSIPNDQSPHIPPSTAHFPPAGNEMGMGTGIRMGMGKGNHFE